MTTKAHKHKKCAICREPFQPRQSFQNWCSPEHGLILANKKLNKSEKVAKTKDRREIKAKLEKIKPRSEWLKEAKTAIQRFRRLEELAKGSGCISCLRSQEEVAGTDGWKPGGAWDGGHFLGKGARPELALEPLNIWLQCKSCNAGSGKYARKGYTVNTAFRINLIDRIGLDAVEALEADHEQRHYSSDDLREIKRIYAAKTRELKARQS